ncbi:hypothetical protein [Azospirillum sp. B4]|uniref:hypothetical protein n=1 Tax=Azospirillum sp. B4 TaxID=95605 RepID=UPI00034C2FA1|nr:hypothetical protein [Azospirillum sp. B4]
MMMALVLAVMPPLTAAAADTSMPAPGSVGRSPAGCLPVTDGTNQVAISSTRTWRTSAIAGRPPVIGTCSIDKSAGSVPLTLDAGSCPVFANESAQTVSQQVTESYTDGLGRQVVTRRCQPVSGAKTWPLVHSILGCAASHEFNLTGSGDSLFAVGSYYVDGGTPKLAIPCTDPAYFQAIQTAGQAPAVKVRHQVVPCANFAGPDGASYRSYRIDLVFDGSDPLQAAGSHTLVGCQPLPEYNPSVTAVVAGSCASKLFHDEVTHTTFLGRQLQGPIRRDDDGPAIRGALTKCVPDPGRWVPQELVVIDYVNDDQHLVSWPRVQWQAMINATTLVPVGDPFVLPMPEPYIAVGYQLVDGSNRGKLLCARWQLQDIYTTYQRSDGTTTKPVFDHPFTPKRLDTCTASAQGEAAQYAADYAAFQQMMSIAAAAGQAVSKIGLPASGN